MHKPILRVFLNVPKYQNGIVRPLSLASLVRACLRLKGSNIGSECTNGKQ